MSDNIGQKRDIEEIEINDKIRPITSQADKNVCSAHLGSNVAGEPVESLIQPLSRGCACALDIPARGKTQLIESPQNN